MASGSGGDRNVFQEWIACACFKTWGKTRDTLPIDHGDTKPTSAATFGAGGADDERADSIKRSMTGITTRTSVSTIKVASKGE